MEVKPLLPPVTVNGVTLDPGRIADEAQNHPAPKGKPGHAWKSAARALTIRELLLQRAKTVGIAADPTETAPGRLLRPDQPGRPVPEGIGLGGHRPRPAARAAGPAEAGARRGAARPA